MSDGWAIAGSIAGIVGTLLAIISAVIAWVQAVKSRKASGAATQAKNESVDLTAKIVEILESQTSVQRTLVESAVPTDLPETWSHARLVSGSLYAIRNTSGQPIHVSAVTTIPAEAAELLRVRTPVPGSVPAGGELRFLAPGRWGLSIQAVRLAWSANGGVIQQDTVPIDHP